MTEILIVDDVPENCRYLANLLMEKSFHVRALPNAKLAKMSIVQHPPDLILLDIMMPETDGYSLCAWLKSSDLYKDIPVIFLSAKTEEVDIVKGFEYGAVDFIRKPFYPLEVYKRVDMQLELVAQRKEIESTLSETLLGAIKAILDIVSIVDTSLYNQSNTVARWMKEVVERLKLKDVWRFEVAALMYNLDELLYSGQIIKDHQETLMALKETQAGHQVHHQIISNIPRMSQVSEMMKEPSHKEFDLMDDTEKGQYLLATINNLYDLSQNHLLEENFYKNKGQVGLYLHDIIEAEKQLKKVTYTMDQILSGIIVLEDIKTLSGTKLIAKGTQLTTNLIELLRKFHKSEGIQMPIVGSGQK